VGVNVGFFKDRLTAEFAYYNNDVDDLILNVPQAPSAGLPNSPPANVGTMYNRGVEVDIKATPIQKRDFSWNSSFNITYNKNMVTSLAPGLTNILSITSGSETVSRTQPGYPLGYLWVLPTAGVDPSTGKRIFVDATGQKVYYQFYTTNATSTTPRTYNYSTTPDGTTEYVRRVNGSDVKTITPANDAVMYANTQPKIYGGWDNTFRYKNFDLNLLVTYQADFYVYYGSGAGLHDQRWWNNERDVLTDAWMVKEDANKRWARPVLNDNVSNGSAMPMDINVYKGDFIKFKNLTLGYTLPKSLTDKIKISNFRIYASSQNLGIVTKYPGPDPEVSSNGNSTTSQGVDRNTAANARTFLIGLNVGF
jgi:TonB-dependent starch-binding outer membrane protein SusC